MKKAARPTGETGIESDKFRWAALQEAQARRCGPTFCVMPWIGLDVRPDGSAAPCCLYRGSAGRIDDPSPEGVWNSPQMRRLRQDMLTGAENPGCAGCHEMDRLGLRSPRQKRNMGFFPLLPPPARPGGDGTVAEDRLVVLDLKLSNVCNFRCRTCGPHYSTAWYGDARSLAAMDGEEFSYSQALRPMEDRRAFWRRLEPLLRRARQINFAGGEPLLQEEHYEILDYLTSRRRFDVALTYNTNFSATRLGRRDVLKYWSKFRDVVVCASLDATGRRGEYLRKGQRWEQAARERERMAKACPRAAFLAVPTISALNVLHLPDLHRELVEGGLIAVKDIAFSNILVQPRHYRVQVLPQRLKEEAAARLASHEAWLEARQGKTGGAQAEDLKALARFMMAEDLSAELPRLRRETRRLDRLRGESFAEVFPELAGLLEG